MNYRAFSNCVACDYADGIAVLNLQTNIYYSLDPVGATVWAALVPGADIATIVAAVTEEFDVTAEVCKPDIESLLSDMAAQNLVETFP